MNFFLCYYVVHFSNPILISFCFGFRCQEYYLTKLKLSNSKSSMESKAETETQGEVVIKYEPFRFNGNSNESVLIAHSYRKYIRSNPSSVGQVSGHGGTSKYAQWRLHSVNNDTFKLENIYSGKYLRIINNGNSVDVGGGGGKYTLFKVQQHKLSNNNMVQPHMISLQSMAFPGCFIAVNGQCNVYSFNINNQQNQNKNDINLYLYARPYQPQKQQQQQQQESKEWNNDNIALKPGIVAIEHAFNKHLRVKPQNELNANGMLNISFLFFLFKLWIETKY